ncbi:MAG: UpxY family transcription antiterminator [Bacteroidota bacterium]
MQKWYAFYTKSRVEKKVAERLRGLGYEVFLPLTTVVRQWSDRKKKVIIPLFNSYIFVHVQEHRIQEVLQVPGVAWSIRLDGKAAFLREQEKDIIERLIGLGHTIDVGGLPEVIIGQTVKVVEGPLKGIEGKIVKTNPDQVTIELNSISQSLSITINPLLLEEI